MFILISGLEEVKIYFYIYVVSHSTSRLIWVMESTVDYLSTKQHTDKGSINIAERAAASELDDDTVKTKSKRRGCHIARNTSTNEC